MPQFVDQTTVHPAGLVALAIAVLGVFSLRRPMVPLAFILLLMSTTNAQRVVAFGLDFSFLRILIVFAVLRAILSGCFDQKRDPLDTVIVCYAIWSVFACLVLFGSIDPLITRSGYLMEILGAYVVGRVYVRSKRDMYSLVYATSFVAFAASVLFVIEQNTGRNFFSVFGGVPEETLLRDGRLRAQGPFSHPIMAGTFFAALIPLYVGLIAERPGAKFAAFVGLISSITIVFCTASSTPLMAGLAGFGGLILFRMRSYMKQIRWGVVFTLCGLQLVMNAPVWHLISRIDVVGGSTGWHRYHLIDQTVSRFTEWALVGTRSTAHWGHMMQDVTNQYVLEAVRSGLIGLVLFVSMLCILFRRVGSAIAVSERRSDEFAYWAAGTMLFVHCVSFIAASYFGQLVVGLFLFLGMLMSVCNGELGKNDARRASEQQSRRSMDDDSAPFSPLEPGRFRGS